jgi:hypothetical protein
MSAREERCARRRAGRPARCGREPNEAIEAKLTKRTQPEKGNDFNGRLRPLPGGVRRVYASGE